MIYNNLLLYPSALGRLPASLPSNLPFCWNFYQGMFSPDQEASSPPQEALPRREGDFPQFLSLNSLSSQELVQSSINLLFPRQFYSKWRWKLIENDGFSIPTRPFPIPSSSNGWWFWTIKDSGLLTGFQGNWTIATVLLRLEILFYAE